PLTSPLAFTPATQASYPAILDLNLTAGNVTELIAAINQANANPGLDTITLTSTTFNLTSIAFDDFGFGPTGLPLITDDLIIRGGNTTTKSTIQRADGTPDFRILAIQNVPDNQVDLTLENLIIRNGRATGQNPFGDDGGGILNVGGNLTIRNSEIRDNLAHDDGGGILNVGTREHVAKLTMENSIVTNNRVSGEGVGNGDLDDGGAGIDADGNGRAGRIGVEVNLTNVEITGITADRGSGGGIRIVDGGKISLDQVTITGNSSQFGSGIAVGDTNLPIEFLQVTNSTIKNNTGGGQDIQSLFHAIQNNDPIVDQYPNLPPGGAGIVAPILPTDESKLFGNDIPPDPTSTTGSNIPGLPLNPVNPTVVVEQISGTRILDGATLNLTVVAGQSLPPFSFRIRNAGENPLGIDGLNFTNDTEFNLVPTAFSLATLSGPPNPTVQDLTLSLLADTAVAGSTFSTGISFEVDNPDANSDLVNGVSADGIFDFTVNVSIIDAIVTPPPGASSLLAVDTTTSVFTAGFGTGGNVKISVLNAQQALNKSLIQDLKITYVSGGNLTEQLFSVLPVVGQPRGFGVGLQSFLLNNVNNAPFSGNETFRIELADRNVASQINVNAGGNGVHDIIFDTNGDGQFNNQDLILRINQTNEAIPLGVGTVQANGLELIDLRGAAGNRVASFTLYREATFDNTVGLYRIDDISGAVNGIAPGQAGYAQAALSNRLPGVTLAVGNQQSRTVTATLEGGALYAPFIVVNAGVDAFLSSNPNNRAGGINAFFAFQTANPDRQNHVMLLGSNTFGFEDLFGGGDRDFNDMIFQVQIT
ncbi:MAG: DUF4114 domain-containing protein, partial [Spirulina sp. DLM2.Bin59]